MQIIEPAGGKIIDNRYMTAVMHQALNKMRTDKTRTPGNQYQFRHSHP
jgi:hypothetical protein